MGGRGSRRALCVRLGGSLALPNHERPLWFLSIALWPQGGPLMDRAAIYGATLRHFFAPVADLLYDDESVTEVLINGPGEIYCERGGRLEKTNRRFPDEQSLDAAVQNLAEYVHRR